MEKISRNEKDRIYCEYFKGYFGIQFTMERYENSVECQVSSKIYGVIFGKPWIAERCATYDTKTRILQLFYYGLCCGLITRPQQSIPKIPSILEETLPKKNPSIEVEPSKDHEQAQPTIDPHVEPLFRATKTKTKEKPMADHAPKQSHHPRRSRTRKRPKKCQGSYKTSMLHLQPHLPPLLRIPKSLLKDP